jgi:anti-sigma B factor antagonist
MVLKGRFDAHEIIPVKEWIKEQVEAGHVRLCINLTEVNFIDSSALSALVQGLKHCREAGGELVLCSLPQPVRVIFELTRLDKAFQIFATEEEALQAK